MTAVAQEILKRSLGGESGNVIILVPRLQLHHVVCIELGNNV